MSEWVQFRDTITEAIAMAEEDMGGMKIVEAVEKALFTSACRCLNDGNHVREAIYWAAFEALADLRAAHQHDIEQLKEARS
jgi:hypothetical protein